MAQEPDGAAQNQGPAQLEAEFDKPLQDEPHWLQSLFPLLGTSDIGAFLFDRLHAAATRDDRIEQLAAAYEEVLAGDSARALTSEQRAELFGHAAHFSLVVRKNGDVAVRYVAQALALTDGSEALFSLCDSVLKEVGDFAQAAKLYLDAAAESSDVERRVRILEHGIRMLEASDAEHGEAHALPLKDSLVRIRPAEHVGWFELLRREYEEQKRYPELVELLEAVLGADPPLSEPERAPIRLRLISLYEQSIVDRARATAHIEALAEEGTADESLIGLAEPLLEHRPVAARIAAVLSEVHAKLKRTGDEISSLTLELRLARPPRLGKVHRRLAALRQDALDDPAGAVELLEPIISKEPGDDEARARYVSASTALGREKDAARLLARVTRNAPDDAARARISFDVAQLFLQAGDEQRARMVFEQVLEFRGDGAPMLGAARLLLAQRSSLSLHVMGRALAALAEHEPDSTVRCDAAAELLELSDRVRINTHAQMVAWRALLDSPREAEALGHLELLYQEAGDHARLSEVYERRAAIETNPDAARLLSYRSIELRVADEADPERALRAWRRHVAQYGPSRAAYARMVPLLEQSQGFIELANVLFDDANLVRGAERAAVLGHLAEVRFRDLDDAPGAFEALRESLALAPDEERSRGLLEGLLTHETLAQSAAELLESICRDESATSEHGARVLVRILELRAQRAKSSAERDASWAELRDQLETIPLGPEEKLDICGRIVATIATDHPDGLPEWIERMARYAPDSATARAQVLLGIVEGGKVDAQATTTLRVAAAAALENAGEPARAFEQYELALEATASPAILVRADALARQLEHAIEHRSARFEEALDRATEPEERADILHAMATLAEVDQQDPSQAIAAWQRALEACPMHRPSHEALVRVLTALGDDAALERELVRAMEHSEGAQRQTTILQLAEALARWGRHAAAAQLWRPLVDEPLADDKVLEALERMASEAEDAEALSRILQQRVETAGDTMARARALERLGEFLNDWQRDPVGAARCWKEAAEQYLGVQSSLSEAVHLYERVLGVAPEDAEAARRVIELYSEVGEWTRIPEAFAVLQRASKASASSVELVLWLEPRAIQAGAASEFADLVEALLWGAEEGASPWARALLSAKARVFASAGHYEEAAQVYRVLLESYPDEQPERDAQDFEALIDASPDAEWRRGTLRWLFEWRVERSAEPVPLLLQWASMEESDFDDPQAAIVLLERAVQRDPQNLQALEKISTLRMKGGDVDGGLVFLRRLREAAPDSSRSMVLAGARSLIGPLERAGDGLTLVEALLEDDPADPEARRAAFGALAKKGAVRERAAEILERASSAADSPSDRRALLQRLLHETAEEDNWDDSDLSPEMQPQRRRWFDGLLDLGDGPEALAVAERAVFEFPDQESLWKKLEMLGVEQGEPQKVVRAYQHALGRPLSAEIAEELGRRLVAFGEEHGLEPRGLTSALERVLELSPGARWVLDRVKLALSLEQRWDSLFAHYDRAIGVAHDEAERADLLDEGAIAARDVVGNLDRAIGYWEQLFELRPGDPRVDMALERLYERRSLTERLIAHLSLRLPSLTSGEQRSLRRRMATLWLDLGRAQPALDLIEGLLSEDAEDVPAYELLERIVALRVVPAEKGELEPARRPPAHDVDGPESDALDRTARLAAQRLRHRFARLGRSVDLARMLQAELALAETPEDRADRLRELLELRVKTLADLPGAFDCLHELVLLEPTEPAHRADLAALADQLGAHDRMATTLVAASERVSDPNSVAVLLDEAARVYQYQLSDALRAAELYENILDSEADSSVRLAAGQALEGILRTLGQSEERCRVLERLASIETDPAALRATLIEAARVASEELGDPRRAARGLQRVVRDTPTDRASLDELIRVLRAGECWSELCEALAARVRSNRHGGEARRDLAEIAALFSERLGDADRAVEIWRLIRKRYGEDADSLEALATLLERRQRWGELATLLSDSAAAAPSSCAIYARLAQVHRDHTGDLTAAVHAYIAAQDWPTATDLWEGALESLGEDVALAAKLGAALKAAKQYNEAERVLRRQLERCSRRSPKERAALYCELAELLREAGRSDAAKAELVSAVERHPADARILAALGELALELGDLERAEQSFRMLLLVLHRSGDGLDGTLTRAEVYVELAEIATRRGDTNGARDSLAAAFEVALNNQQEGLGLERALRHWGRLDELERALVLRLEGSADPLEASRTIEQLVEVGAGRHEGDTAFAAKLLDHAQRVERGLEGKADDPSYMQACRALVEIYRRLGALDRVGELLSAMAAHAPSPEQRADLELEAARLLLQVPASRARAVERLQALADREASHADTFDLLCRVLEEDGRLEDLLGHVEARLDAGTKPLDRATLDALRLRKAEVLERMERIDDAIRTYESLSAGSSALGLEALRAIARLEEARGADPARLASVLERLLVLEKGREGAQLVLRILALRGPDADAKACERILKIGFSADPTQAETRERLVGIYVDQEQWTKAASILERAAEALPDDSSLRFRLSEMLQRAGDLEGALAALVFVPKTRAEEAEFGYRRFLMLEAAGRSEEAVEELDAAHLVDGRFGSELLSAIQRAELHVQAERWALRAADLLAEAGETAQARASLAHWLEAHPGNLPALRRLAVLASKENDLAVAVEAYRSLIRSEPSAERAAAALELARLCEEADRPGDALAELEWVLQQTPDLPALRQRLRRLYARAGAHRQEAQMLLDEAAREVSPAQRAERLLEAAELLCRENAADEAMRVAEELRHVAPDRIEGALLFARLLKEAGKPAEAMAALKSFTEDYSPRPSKPLGRLYRQVAELHLADDELVEAFEALGQAHRLNKADAEAAFLLGLVAVDLDEWETASSALRTFVAIKGEVVTATQNDEPSPASRAYYHLAWIEYAKGHTAAARRMASRALEEGPHNHDARRLLDTLSASHGV